MMHLLEVAVLLAFVTTAQGGCTLTLINDVKNFRGETVDAFNAKNVLQCARLCYDANKCDAMIFDKVCYQSCFIFA
ncbi:hypothetical protein Y032_0718g1796 [Ancylostoma ceylanicum]|uniref:Apple domain-containing protein n=1 Tax=Ancylostoma ceylanicum TaxID=53326 RepID=A0A016WEZ6_9BILA|nr:hypothetical protein Y032_0718g1796 [Ancylostoma ceylanicum]